DRGARARDRGAEARARRAISPAEHAGRTAGEPVVAADLRPQRVAAAARTETPRRLLAPHEEDDSRKPRACAGGFAVTIDTNSPNGLRDKLQARTARAGVIGLGYVGLPLAVEFARAGLTTTGIDLDRRKVDAVNQGTSYIPDVQTADVARLVADQKLSATTDFSVIAGLDTINICVPTPLRKTKDPDMSYIVSAVEQIAKYLHRGMLIVLESTTYPGTTEELVKPMLEESGLRAGVDFFLAFSPERVDPGNGVFFTRTVPKVIGGTTPACSELASALYSAAIDTLV